MSPVDVLVILQEIGTLIPTLEAFITSGQIQTN